jgi:hypothetical protein
VKGSGVEFRRAAFVSVSPSTRIERVNLIAANRNPYCLRPNRTAYRYELAVLTTED